MASDEAHSQGETGGKEIGTSLTATTDTIIGPFIAAANSAPPPRRGLGARLLDYSAHAAIVVGLIGFAWTVSSHLATQPTAAQIETPMKAAKAADAPKTAEAPKHDDLADLRQANSQMAADIKTLRANLDSLRTAGRQDKTPGEVRALEADLKTVKSGLTSARTETVTAIAQLSGKIEKLQHDVPPKQQVAERPTHDHAAIDATPTGSLGTGATTVAKAVPTPPAKPTATKLASAEERNKEPDDISNKPQVISGWVVRDVQDGVALIEGKRGPMEVVPGVSIPGAGTVKSIERHGNGWTVTTSKGLLAYAAQPHDYRRAIAREYYPPPPYMNDY